MKAIIQPLVAVVELKKQGQLGLTVHKNAKTPFYILIITL